MEFKIEDKPMASVLKVKLNSGEALNAQPGAMMLMMGNIKVDTSMQGGFLKGMMRKALGGETLFINNAGENCHLLVYPNITGNETGCNVDGGGPIDVGLNTREK